MKQFYFDHNATTPLSPEVLAAMQPVWTDAFGNASSIHQYGQQARGLLDQARRDVAAMLETRAEEIVFTSGGTEADNMALFGVCGHVITTANEHPAILQAAQQLARQQPNDVTIVPVDSRGLVDPGDVQKAIRHATGKVTALVSVMHVNSELGVIQPIAEIARLAHEAGVLFHSDGVQALGRVPVSVQQTGVDLYSMSAHKIYGPKGAGALFVRKGVNLRPLLHGGSQERKRRGGTENVAGVVGFARAAQWVKNESAAEAARQGALRDRLETALLDRIPDAHVNGAGAPRVANTCNIRFDGITSEPLLIALDMRGFAVSSGSACSSGSTTGSAVRRTSATRRRRSG